MGIISGSDGTKQKAHVRAFVKENNNDQSHHAKGRPLPVGVLAARF
jgi:hypothetical protein